MIYEQRLLFCVSHPADVVITTSLSCPHDVAMSVSCYSDIIASYMGMLFIYFCLIQFYGNDKCQCSMINCVGVWFKLTTRIC